MYSAIEFISHTDRFSLIFQDDFVKLEGIQTLDLSKNRLTILPENFGQIKSLKQLDLFENQLTDLPISFSELTKLEVRKMSINRIEMTFCFVSLVFRFEKQSSRC